MELKLYNMKGDNIGALEVKDEVFGVEYNEPLIHQVVVAQLANKRQGTKSTLTRAEVRGGGRKPYRQKGTGRARQGSTRSPQWTKGGVVFAPKPRDYSKKVNSKMKEKALLSALSAKVSGGKLIVLDSLTLEKIKTKDMATVLKNLSIDKRVLIVTADKDNNVVLSARNIPTARVTPAELINVYDLVANATCLITKDAVKFLEEVYA